MDYSTFEEVETLIKREIENKNLPGEYWNTLTLCCDDVEEQIITEDMRRFKLMPQFSELTERDIYIVLVYSFYMNYNVSAISNLENNYQIKLLDTNFLEKNLFNKEVGMRLYYFLVFQNVNGLFKLFIEHNLATITKKPTIKLCCNNEEIKDITNFMIHFKKITQFSELTERDIYLVLVYFFYIDNNDILRNLNILTRDFLYQYLTNKDLGMRFYETHSENINNFDDVESKFREYIISIIAKKKAKIKAEEEENNNNGFVPKKESYRKIMRKNTILEEIGKMRICCTLIERIDIMTITNYIRLLPKYDSLTTRDIYVILIYIYYSLKYGEQTDDDLTLKFLLITISENLSKKDEHLSDEELIKKKLILDLYVQLTTGDLILDHPAIIDGNLSGMVRRLVMFDEVKPIAEEKLESGSTRLVTLNLDVTPSRRNISMMPLDSPLDYPIYSPPFRSPSPIKSSYFLNNKLLSRRGGKTKKRKNKKNITKKRKVRR